MCTLSFVVVGFMRGRPDVSRTYHVGALCPRHYEDSVWQVRSCVSPGALFWDVTGVLCPLSLDAATLANFTTKRLCHIIYIYS